MIAADGGSRRMFCIMVVFYPLVHDQPLHHGTCNFIYIDDLYASQIHYAFFTQVDRRIEEEVVNSHGTTSQTVCVQTLIRLKTQSRMEHSRTREYHLP